MTKKDIEKMYLTDFDTKPIGGGNPYSACSRCGRSVPEINGNLYKHDEYCEYRIKKEASLLSGGVLKIHLLAEFNGYDDENQLWVAVEKVNGFEIREMYGFDPLSEFKSLLGFLEVKHTLITSNFKTFEEAKGQHESQASEHAYAIYACLNKVS